MVMSHIDNRDALPPLCASEIVSMAQIPNQKRIEVNMHSAKMCIFASDAFGKKDKNKTKILDS